MDKCKNCNIQGKISYNTNNLCKRNCSCKEQNICIKCKFYNTTRFCIECDKNLRNICSVCNKCLRCSILFHEECTCYKCSEFEYP